MNHLLMLVHRIPYPPNKGDKVRSFNLLKHLARDYRVHLGAFIDDPDDWRHMPVLEELCEDLCLLGISPRLRKLKGLTGLLRGEAMSLPYYRHRRMRAWVRRKLAGEDIRQVVVFSSTMAQYLMGDGGHGVHRIVDFVDVDSEKWRQYGRHHRWPVSRLYAREGRKLLEFERRVAARFDASVFVTEQEAALFRRLAPEVAGRVTHMSNGVDGEFFSLRREYPNPYAPGDRVLVFTGAMDYRANTDAVGWFAQHVLPTIRERVPRAKFYIVGARPAEAVRRLAAIEGVHVTGAVKEIRPYLAHAAAAVAPLRIARGLQNKVLEAMAMGKPVLATPAAMEGIRAGAEFSHLVSDAPAELAARAVELLTVGDRHGLGARGRALVTGQYAWSSQLARFERLLQRAAQPMEQVCRSAVESGPGKRAVHGRIL